MPDFLSRLRELESAAKQGPWEVHEGGNTICVREEGLCNLIVEVDTRPSLPNTTLIVFLRNHAAALADLVEAATAIADLRAELPNVEYHADTYTIAMDTLRAALSRLDEP